MRTSLFVFMIVAVAAPVAAAQAPDSAMVVAVRRHVAVLAHDSLRGRATPSPGLESAARYAAGQLRRAGARPAGDSGTFIQRYAIVRTRLVAESSTVELIGGNGARYRLGHEADWIRSSVPVRGPITGQAFLLTGTPDSAAPFAGHAVRGGVIVHLAPMTAEGAADTPDWLFAAAARAHVGAWIEVVDRDDERWRELIGRIAEPRVVVPGMAGVWPFPIVEMRDGTIGAWLAEAGIPHAGVRPIPQLRPALARLDGLTVRVRLRERVLSRRSAPNVVARIPGRDSTRGAVILAAHLDGLGIGPALGDDSIYNGADDNASGVAAVIEAARRLVADRAAGPVVIALFSGTETEAWGSRYYLGRPVVPLTATRAFINVEAVGRNLHDTVAVIGGEQSGLDATVAGLRPAAAAFGLTIARDPWPSHRLWTLGDHAIFRERGIPALYLFNGRHPDQHRPGDDAPKVDPGTIARVAQLTALLARQLADTIP